MKNLPDLPSELIRVAMKDLRSCEQDERYFIEMNFWHKPSLLHETGGIVCAVCFAGSVMAKTLDANPNVDTTPYEYTVGWLGQFFGKKEQKNKLRTLDKFRVGDVDDALRFMGLKSVVVEDRSIDDYEFDSSYRFHDDMRLLADELETAGL